MAIATTPQELSQIGVSSFVDGLSHTAAASMAAVFPPPISYHSSCKRAASMSPAVLPFRNIDCSSLEAEDIYGFEDDSPPFPLQYTPVDNIGAGLANLGNTCFLNSVLQCLTYTPPLATHLRAGLHNRSCNIKGFCAMCAMERHVRDALSSSGRIVSPSHLVKNLRSISRSFQLWRQEDAHEYMRYLIEALQRCCSVELLGGGSFIKSVFGGRLRSQVKCTQCSHCSNKYDPFLDLSLEVNRADSLNKALAHFTAIEVLDGENQYHCSKCKTKVRALKQFTIDKAPPILTVQLKRFSSSGSYGGKIDKKVHFERDLDLTPFVTGAEGEKLRYSLYAVLVHSGWSTHSGHYYCFVRTATDTWHAMDDSEVSQVSESTVLAQKAYILFYVRNAIPTTSLETDFLNKNLTNAITSAHTNDHHQENSDCLEMSENKSNFPCSGNKPLASNEVERSSAVEQVVTLSKSCDNCSNPTSRVLQEKMPFPEALKVAKGKHSVSPTESAVSPNCVKTISVESLNDSCEESWYRAIQKISKSPISPRSCVEIRAGEDACSMKEADLQEQSCEREQGVCTDGSRGGDEEAAASSSCFGDDANPLADSDETSTPNTCQQRRHTFLDFVSPILRTARLETAGQHALSILCMCARYCFWSCFWPPL